MFNSLRLGEYVESHGIDSQIVLMIADVVTINMSNLEAQRCADKR